MAISGLAPTLPKQKMSYDFFYITLLVTGPIFPYRQRCRLKFGSWTYDGFQLDLVPEGPEGSKKKFVPNGEWDLVDIPAERNELKYDCCPEPYPDVTFIIILQRKYLFYLFNLVIPCFVIVRKFLTSC